MLFIPPLSSFPRHYMTLVVKKYREAGERAEELAQCSLDSPFLRLLYS